MSLKYEPSSEPLHISLPHSLPHSLTLTQAGALLAARVRQARRHRRSARPPYTLHPTPYTLHPTPYTLTSAVRPPSPTPPFGCRVCTRPPSPGDLPSRPNSIIVLTTSTVLLTGPERETITLKHICGASPPDWESAGGSTPTPYTLNPEP